MTTPSWEIRGQYYETCSCDFVCACILGQMAARPTKGTCTFAMAMQVDRGHFGDVPLDGLTFIVLGLTPEEMGKGNWSVGLLVDESASQAQREAIGAITSGSVGGPMAALSGLVGTFLGMEAARIKIDRSGVSWSVNAAPLLEMAATGAMGIDPQATEPMHIDNTGHPVNSRLALARASRSHVHALGLSWDDDSGRNNGHFAPFAWRS
jgi:hypothetical protein